MITNKLFGIREVLGVMIVAALLFLGATLTFAQTSTFTPPSGYNQVGSSGVYYNDRTGLYYNPMTGQYTNLRPLGTAQRDASGNFIVPSGYSQVGTTGYYYNSATGYYYDPMTGFYSTTAPSTTGVTLQVAQNYTPSQTTTGTTGSAIVPGPGITGTVTPGVPNTGAGDGTMTLALLALFGVAAVTGAVSLSRRTM